MKATYNRIVLALLIFSWCLLLQERLGILSHKSLGDIAFAVMTLVIFAGAYSLIKLLASKQALHIELAASKDYLEKIINSIAEAIIITDENGIIRTMNRSAEKLTFSSLAENIGQPLEKIYDVIHEETGRPVQNIVKRILNDGRTVEFENNTVLRKKNIETVIISNSASVVYDKQGNVNGAVLVFKDVTERKRLINENRDLTKRLEVESKKAELLLDKREAFYSGILQSLVSHIAVINAEGQIVATNDAWNRFSVENGETVLDRTSVGSSYFEVCQRSYQNGNEMAMQALRGIKDVIDGTEEVFYTEYPCHSLDKQIWFSMRVVKFHNDDNLVIVSHDNITATKLAELEVEKMAFDLIQRNKNIEQFSYIVSHNLRAPLANILGFAELLKSSAAPPEFAELKDGIYTAAYAMDDIIRDLNNILQIGSQLFENRVLVRFEDVAESVSSGIDNILKNQNITIETDFESVPNMLTIKSYLYSIFYNLIYNSIKYQNPDKKTVIEISSEKTTNGLRLMFKDNGLGIDLKKNGQKLFGLYKRFHQNTEGKGMGLYMVKKQVETLGGKITAKSEVGEGTEFIIEFNL